MLDGIAFGGADCHNRSVMTPDTAHQPSASGMSEAGRLSGVIFEPGKAFSDIAARPRYLVPLALLILVAIAFTASVSARVGWDQAMRSAIEQAPQTRNIPAEKREEIIQQQGRVMSVAAYPLAVVAPVVMIVIASAIYLFVFRTFLSAPVTYRQMVAIYCYASIPGIISSLLAILVMYMKPPEDFDLQNPLAFNLAAFLPESAPRWLAAAGASLDAFMIWSLLLIVVGVRAAAPGLSTGTAFAGVFGPWLVWILLKSGWAAMF
jgi:hypothetical protein